MDPTIRRIGVPATIAMMVLLGFVIFAITAPPGGLGRGSTSSGITGTGPNAADLSVSATLTEPTVSSNALFTLFVANLGNSTFESFNVYLTCLTQVHEHLFVKSRFPVGVTRSRTYVVQVSFPPLVGRSYCLCFFIRHLCVFLAAAMKLRAANAKKSDNPT